MSVSQSWKDAMKSERREREAKRSLGEERRETFLRRLPEGVESSAEGAGEGISPTQRVVYVAGRGFVTLVRCAMTDAWIDASTGKPASAEILRGGA